MFLTPIAPAPTSGRTRHCSVCEQTRPIEGGIEKSPGRWVCGSCWRKKAAAPKKGVPRPKK